jgi:hypothetical protein
MEALNVRPQVLMTEKFVKERSILGVGGTELLKPFLGVRNRSWHVGSGRYTGTLGGVVCGGAL